MTPATRAPTRGQRVAGVAWRGAVGVGVGAAMAVAGLAVPVAVGTGGAVAAVLVVTGNRRSGRTRTDRPRIDPFTVGEPWRQFVIGARRADQQLRRTVADVDDGPLRDRLDSIAGRLDEGLAETWRIARRGDEIDDAIARLDPAALRSRQERLQGAEEPRPAELEAVERQLDAVERLREQSAATADTLRLLTARFDELAARATEVAVGTADTSEYAHEVDDLLIEMESLRLALEETRDQ